MWGHFTRGEMVAVDHRQDIDEYEASLGETWTTPIKARDRRLPRSVAAGSADRDSEKLRRLTVATVSVGVYFDAWCLANSSGMNLPSFT